ncbi:MAG TPA: hypothetical protein VE197_14195, partial [Mycobacterium sp.]|nr:hypothetical protein [Mycobacterium sp.]
MRAGLLLATTAAATFVLAQAALAAGHARRAHMAATAIQPSASGSNVDCNGWSEAYAPARPQMRALCTDPIAINRQGKASRLTDNGWYVGHDEPSVAPWFGLPICDPNSYPQNPCTQDSDTNTGGISDPNAAGSAFMELQFYPPGFTPFLDSESCSPTRWCSALNIDSLECTYGFATCNTNCIEPVNFAFLQLNGMPSGPPDPQAPSVRTFLPNRLTLMMNPGDVLKVSISDSPGGLKTVVHDLTSGQTGYMQASATNGFANTSISDCSGTPFTFHAEYSTAEQQNQVPWAALEGGVLMEQEIGHFESCDRLAVRDGNSQSFPDGTSYVDRRVFQT